MGSTRRRTAAGLLVAALALGLSALPPTSATGGSGKAPAADDATALAAAIDTHIAAVNARLQEERAPVRLYRSEAMTVGLGQLRVGNRFKIYYGHRWVPGDERRAADGDRLRYLVDQSDGATTSGLANADTEPAVDRTVATWGQEDCLSAAPLDKLPDTGADPDFIDGLLLPDRYTSSTPGADIIYAGWYPAELFTAYAGSLGSRIIAFSDTLVFVDPETFAPTDVNHDGYLDTAVNEIYFQDGLPGQYYLLWAIDLPSGSPGIDVETIALHEFGHSLGLGHFGPPPVAAMNPGIRNPPGRPVTYASDSSAICALYASWPKP